MSHTTRKKTSDCLLTLIWSSATPPSLDVGNASAFPWRGVAENFYAHYIFCGTTSDFVITCRGGVCFLTAFTRDHKFSPAINRGITPYKLCKMIQLGCTGSAQVKPKISHTHTHITAHTSQKVSLSSEISCFYNKLTHIQHTSNLVELSNRVRI